MADFDIGKFLINADPSLSPGLYSHRIISNHYSKLVLITRANCPLTALKTGKKREREGVRENRSNAAQCTFFISLF